MNTQGGTPRPARYVPPEGYDPELAQNEFSDFTEQKDSTNISPCLSRKRLREFYQNFNSFEPV